MKLVEDPCLAVLIDQLLADGVVRDIGVWTDEEAETCRLQAFALAQSNAPWHHGGPLEPEHVPARPDARFWARRLAYGTYSVERFFSVFEMPDHALSAHLVDRDAERRWMERTEVSP